MRRVAIEIDTPIVDRTMRLLKRLFPSPRHFTVRLWGERELPPEGESRFTLTLNHPGALRRMLTPPLELAIGEAYIYGDFDLDGDLFAALHTLAALLSAERSWSDLVALLKDSRSLPDQGPDRVTTRSPVDLSGAIHSRDRDRAAVRFHYDVGNDFYGLWLDRNRQYSCAYFPTGLEDLDTAQERKLLHIGRKLQLQPGDRLLDIGCGWGGLTILAAQAFGVQAVGITLSEKQAAYGAEQVTQLGLADRVHIEVRDYRDLDAAPFDKVVSVGMFEHVGREKLPEYFGQVYRLVKPGGLFLNHGISRRATAADLSLLKGLQRPAPPAPPLEERLIGPGTFSQRYIFPDSELVPVSEANLIAEAAGFEVRDVENLREHYDLTLRHWVDRLDARRADAVRLVGESLYRTWRLYLSYARLQFETAAINVNQSLLARPDSGRAGLPLSRVGWYVEP